MRLRIKKINNSTLDFPKYQTNGSAGMDLMADLGADNNEEIIKVNETKLIRTGLAIDLDEGYEAQIRSRSGLSLRNGLIVLNSPGTIDTDYREEICIILKNFGTEDFVVKHGMRIAQMVIAKYEQVKFEIVDEFKEGNTRGGFGSTGV